MNYLDKTDLYNIVSLKRYKEFNLFMDILAKKANYLSSKCIVTKDDVEARWLQGRVQELLDLMRDIKRADEELKARQNAK